jgi:hypothetical protein
MLSGIGYNMERLTEDQFWVWNRWSDLQKHFPEVTTNEESNKGYMEWWRVYFPSEMSARLYNPALTVSRDNFLLIPGHRLRVLIVTPTTVAYDYCWDKYWKAVQELDGNFDILIVENSDTPGYYEKLCKRVSDTQHIVMVKYWYDPKYEGVGFSKSQEKLTGVHNYARDVFLGGMYSHFFSIEADVVVEKYALRKLLRAKKPVTLAPIERDGQILAGMFVNYPNSRDMTVHILSKKEIEANPLQQIDWGSIGCALIERHIMERIAWRYNPNSSQHDDIWFAVDCKNYNIPIFLSTTTEVAHLKNK